MNPDEAELGAITIADSVVAKVAARAALDVPDAGSAAPRVLGRSVGAAALVGGRQTSLTALPKTTVHVDGSVALVELSMSVRWPCSIPAVAEQVRNRVRIKVAELTGLHVAEVNIEVSDLVTRLPRPARVR